METITNTLAILPTTKEQVATFAAKLENELQSGSVNPLDIIHVQKCFEKAFEKVKPTLSELARNEAEKYGKSFDYKGAKIELAEVGVKIDYSQCGHLDYNDLCAKIDKLLEQKKNYETMIKTYKEPQNLISIGGEVMTVYPPTKTSTSSIKVTI